MCRGARLAPGQAGPRARRPAGRRLRTRAGRPGAPSALNTNLPSDPELASEYQAINTDYFQGRLPAIGVRWEPRLAEIGPLISSKDSRWTG